MPGQLSNAARRLELARGGVGKAPEGIATLAWVAPVVEIDRARLADGERVVQDVTITGYRDVDPSECEGRERITRDPEELGIVYAYDGRAIGTVRPGRRGGRILEFTWPADLPASAPGRAAG
jgi:hypothetical protein